MTSTLTFPPAPAAQTSSIGAGSRAGSGVATARPDMNGAICVVTGATSGIGRATALGLARLGAKVVIVARSADKAAAVAAEIARIPGAPEAAIVLANLAEMAEVRRAAEEINTRFSRVDVLVCNAAGMFDTFRKSSEGIERTYAINHLAVFLLTLSLRPSLMRARAARVVIVSSNLQKVGYATDYLALVEPKFEWSQLYAQTKLRNLIFAKTLSARWKADGITVNSLHPGVVDTGLMSGWENQTMKAIFTVVQKLFISPEKGARTSIFLASDPSVATVTGTYFDKTRPHPHNPVADDTRVQQQLWAESVARLADAGVSLPEAATQRHVSRVVLPTSPQPPPGLFPMKAITYSKYGPPSVVKLTEVPKPQPKDNEVLIRIHATTVTTGDWRARSLIMPPGFGMLGRLVFGITKPRQPILGSELAGAVESVGSAVTRFRAGDEVIAFPGGHFGSHAEYRTMPEEGMIAHKPANLSFEEAASLSFGSTTALPFLRDKAKVKRGDQVLVIGASGAVGSAAVQIAKHFGAEVTAVTSTGNVNLVQSIGADGVIDYTQVDFATTGETWDIILDTTGTAPFGRCERSLKPGGRLIVVLGTLAQALGIGGPSKASGKHLISGVAPLTPDDLRFIAGLASSGDLKPVIDRVYSLEDAAQAHAYVDTGRKRGSVVLTVKPPGGA